MKSTRFLKRRWRLVVWALAVNDFRLRDQGTLLGFFWTLFHPLIYFAVLYGLFKSWMARIDQFPLYLIIGIVQWNFFVIATTASTRVIMRYGSYIKNIYFPKSALVMASVLTSVFIYLLEMVVLLVFWFIVKQEAGWSVAALPLMIVLLVYLITGVSFTLAVAGVYFLDIQRIWAILTNIGFFLTPIFYSLAMIEPVKRKILLLNPMTHIIEAFRKILIENRLPDAYGVAYVFLISTVLLLAGYWIFRAKEGYFAEKI